MNFHLSGFARFGGRLFQAVNAPRTEQEFCALGTEGARRCRAKSTRRTGD